MWLAVALAEASQVVCRPHPAEVWPPTGATVPPRPVVHVEARRDDAFVLLSGAEPVPLLRRATLPEGGSRVREWAMLAPTEDLPVGSRWTLARVTSEGTAPEPLPYTWTVGPPDHAPPAWTADPTQAPIAGAAGAEPVQVAVPLDEDAVVLVRTPGVLYGDDSYPVVIRDGEISLEAGVCAPPPVVFDGGDTVLVGLQPIDAAGNVGQEREVLVSRRGVVVEPFPAAAGAAARAPVHAGPERDEGPLPVTQAPGVYAFDADGAPLDPRNPSWRLANGKRVDAPGCNDLRFERGRSYTGLGCVKGVVDAKAAWAGRSVLQLGRRVITEAPFPESDRDLVGVVRDDQGALWAAGPGGVARRDRDGWTRVATTRTGAIGVLGGAVVAVLDGRLVIREGEDWTPIQADPGVRRLMPADDGGLWLLGSRGVRHLARDLTVSVAGGPPDAYDVREAGGALLVAAGVGGQWRRDAAGAWTAEAPLGATSPAHRPEPVAFGGPWVFLRYGTTATHLVRVDRRSGHRVPILEARATVAAATADGRLVLVDAGKAREAGVDGAVTDLDAPGFVAAATYAPDGTLVTLGEKGLGRRTAAGWTFGPGPARADRVLVVGADGFAWGTDGATVWRAAPGEPPRVVPVGGGLRGLAVGPDGGAWGVVGNEVVAVAADGSVRRWPAPGAWSVAPVSTGVYVGFVKGEWGWLDPGAETVERRGVIEGASARQAAIVRALDDGTVVATAGRMFHFDAAADRWRLFLADPAAARFGFAEVERLADGRIGGRADGRVWALDPRDGRIVAAPDTYRDTMGLPSELVVGMEPSVRLRGAEGCAAFVTFEYASAPGPLDACGAGNRVSPESGPLQRGFVDAAGTLWTADRALVAQPRQGAVRHFPAAIGEDDSVRLLDGDGAGNVWLGTDRGLWRYQQGAGWTSVSAPIAEGGAAVGDTLWLGTREGLFRLGSDGVAERVSVSVIEPPVPLAVDASGRLAVPAADAAVYTLDGQVRGDPTVPAPLRVLRFDPDGAWTALDAAGYLRRATTTTPVPVSEPRALARWRGRDCVGGDRLLCADEAGWGPVSGVPEPARFEGVRALAVDGDTLWVGTSEGDLCRVQDGVTCTRMSAPILALFAADGQVWVGDTLGLAHVDAGGLARDWEGAGVRAFAAGPRGLFVATDDGVRSTDGVVVAARGSAVDGLAITPDGTLWIVVRGRLLASAP